MKRDRGALGGGVGGGGVSILSKFLLPNSYGLVVKVN